MNRRKLLQGATAAGFAMIASQVGASERKPVKAKPGENATHFTALCLNEDNSHYFYGRAEQKLDAGKVDSWVDQYAHTQVRDLILCPNCMRTNYPSKVWMRNNP